MAKITRRTGRTDKMSGVMGAVIFGAFAIFGLLIPTTNNDPFFNEMAGITTGIKILWVIICACACIYNIYMAIKGEGISKETVDIDSNGDPLIHVSVPPSDSKPSSDFEEKLRKLESLRKDGLLTQAEYKQKRDELLGEKW